ncbi:MAG: glycine--tRNA ligase subunit beta, partial [Armatimonadetes bacterium]|nr:glycine--tRNA ligase subunit beta [Armatimonadota bacterium]
EEGRPAVEVLAEALPGLIAGIPWPRSMRWNASNVAFGRPIRWIVALVGENVIPFTYAGVPSGRVSRGIRSAGSPDFEIEGAGAYLPSLERQGIVPGVKDRRARILDAAGRLAEEVGGRIPESAQGDLLDEVANLIESPTPIRGAFEEKYLELPREVLVGVMKKHQRYFPVEDANGQLLPHFIAVANGAVDEAVVRHGNEEVLRARYSDATFFWNRDTQQSLEAFRPRLSGLIFQEQLGSMLDKSERLEKIIAALADDLGLDTVSRADAERAAHLAKADLVTEMVMDFTSLQGIMGRYYARLSGEDEEVSRAIEEQYRNDPGTLPGVALGLADRLDSLVGLFAVGKAPKSNADPFAQRRAAIGIIEILAHRGLRLDLRWAIEAVAAVQPVQPVGDGVKDDVLEFITRRLEQWLLDRGFRPDGVSAAISPAARGHDPAGALETAEQLARGVETEEFEKTLTAYARSARITRNLELSGEVDECLFEREVERDLWRAYQEARQALDAAEPRDFNALYAQLEALRPAIDTFFDGVLVMAEDERVRHNRLLLLQRIADLTRGIVDLSAIQGF